MTAKIGAAIKLYISSENGKRAAKINAIAINNATAANNANAMNNAIAKK